MDSCLCCDHPYLSRQDVHASRVMSAIVSRAGPRGAGVRSSIQDFAKHHFFTNYTTLRQFSTPTGHGMSTSDMPTI